MTTPKQPLEICTYPNPVLRKKALPINQIDNTIKLLAEQMLELMYIKNGIGLAATQVGILLRLIVVDLQVDGIKQPLVMINPKIITMSTQSIEGEEGCLSLPKIQDIITRSAKLTVEYTDLQQQTHILEAEDLLAVCIQHEVDHLDGILFIDHLSKLKKQLILTKYKKLSKNT